VNTDGDVWVYEVGWTSKTPGEYPDQRTYYRVHSANHAAFLAERQELAKMDAAEALGGDSTGAHYHTLLLEVHKPTRRQASAVVRDWLVTQGIDSKDLVDWADIDL